MNTLLEAAAFAAVAVLVGLVLQRLNDIISLQEAIMAAIDDAAQANLEKVTALTAKVDETIVTLGELKALIGSGNTSNAEAILAQANALVDTALGTLTTAETDADPTPDA